MQGLSLVATSRGHSSSRCAGLSLSRAFLLRSTGSRRAGSVVVAHGPSRSAACGILPDQGPNPCPLHWQADSQPLRHQGSPILGFYFAKWFIEYFTHVLLLLDFSCELANITKHSQTCFFFLAGQPYCESYIISNKLSEFLKDGVCSILY